MITGCAQRLAAETLLADSQLERVGQTAALSQLLALRERTGHARSVRWSLPHSVSQQRHDKDSDARCAHRAMGDVPCVLY